MKKISLLLLLFYTTILQAAHHEENTPKPNQRQKVGSFAGASFIYWTPRVDGLTYAQTGRNSFRTLSQENISDFLDLPAGTDLTVNWQWDPGFKANLGWNFTDEWQINLEYTWLYSKAKDDETNTDGVFPNIDIFPLDLVSALGEVDFAKAAWYLRYQLLQLKVGKTHRYNPAVSYRTSLGATFTYQKQQYDTVYIIPPFSVSFNNTSISSSEQLNFNFSDKQRIFGAGLTLDFAPKWNIVDWFGIEGKAGISYLWMYYRLQRKDFVGANLTLQGEVAGVKAELANIETNLRAMKLFFDTNIGIFFETPTFKDQFQFNFFVGWEAHIWLNQTFQVNLGEELSRFDLTMQGLTAKMQLDF